MDGGWVKLFRKLLKSLIWQHPELCRLFIWCILRANWSDIELFFGRSTSPIKLGRGQFVTGRDAMHREMYPRASKKNPSPVTLYKQLKKLEGMELVSLQSNSQFTIVTVVMFDTYQGFEDDEVTANEQQTISEGKTNEQRTNNERTTKEQRAFTDKKEQELKEEKEAQEEKDKKGGSVSAKTSEINEVVEHYQTYHKRARPGEKERKLIGARLKDGYSVDDLRRAIDGNHRSPFHCGENDRGAKHHSLELIVRNSSQVSKFIEEAEKANEPVLSAKTQKSVRASQSWLDRKQGELDGTV